MELRRHGRFGARADTVGRGIGLGLNEPLEIGDGDGVSVLTDSRSLDSIGTRRCCSPMGGEVGDWREAGCDERAWGLMLLPSG
jgi:hypothetical protein